MAASRRATREDRGTSRITGAAAAGRRVVGSGILTVARLVMLVAVLIAAVIATAVLLKVFDANAGNSIVKDVHDLGKTLVGPFKDVFNIKRPKVSMAVNWGLAALVYLVVGALIARVLRRLALSSHPDRAVP